MAAGRGKQEALGCIKRVALTPTSEGGHALPPGWLKFSPQHLQIQELWEESRESSPGEESLPVSGDQERAGRGGGGGRHTLPGLGCYQPRTVRFEAGRGGGVAWPRLKNWHPGVIVTN